MIEKNAVTGKQAIRLTIIYSDVVGILDPFRQHARLTAYLGDVLVEEPDDPHVELAKVRGVELREGDPRHQVAAVLRLARAHLKAERRIPLSRSRHDDCAG